jgi:group II intron reverse transcriptase/maturase
MHKTQRKNLILTDRGRRGLKLERVYRELYDADRFLSSYAKLYPNDGAMTPGVTPETVDGMSREKIGLIIRRLSDGSFIWKPAKRVYIPKKNGKMRPLGLPTWTDKLVQDVIRSILEPYYEAQFRDSSHGFRPERGCHTALQMCRKRFQGTNWFIEGDIKGCFDNIDHAVLLDILKASIDDDRFIRLVKDMLEAGYLEDWRYHGTNSGTPQGGVISPLLANVYLHELDKFVEDTLIPRYTRGESRKRNPEYTAIVHAMRRAKEAGDKDEWKRLKVEQRKVSVGMPDDPNFRRLDYVRYADDFILALIGPKSEAEDIKREIGEFTQTKLKLTLSEEKTLITHARTEKARFLGYDLKTIHDNGEISTGSNAFGTHTKRAINGKLRLEAPWDKIEAVKRQFMEGGKPIHRKEQLLNDDYSIVVWYSAYFRGIANYYCLAHDRADKLKNLKYVVETSMLKTLANKHRSTVTQMARKYKVWLDTPRGKRKAFQVTVVRPGKKDLVATFGGITLAREEGRAIQDEVTRWWWNSRTEILQRMLADKCEYCGWEGKCEVHHVRQLANILKRGNLTGWRKLMAIKRRKTLVLCRTCHDKLHAGTLD